MADKIRMRLTHICNRKGCEGKIGDIIDVSAADAEWLESVKGGYPLAIDETAKEASQLETTKETSPAGRRAKDDK